MVRRMETSALLLFLCMLFSFCIYRDVQAESQLSSQLPCFAACMCKNFDKIICTANRTFTLHVDDFNQFLVNLEIKPQVHIRTESHSLPGFLPRLPTLFNLSLAENKLSVIQNGVLKGMRLRELNLSHNELQAIGDKAFLDLHYLQVLDLSHNRLSSTSKLVFADLPNLKLLNLDWNYLLYFPFDAFSEVPHLEVLNLNHNQLSYLMPGALVRLSSLRNLGLRNNSLWSVTVPLREEAPALKSLDVSANPFHCSCGVEGLRSILNDSAVVLSHPDQMNCFTPLSLRNQPVIDVLTELQECQKPLSVLRYDARSVLYLDDVQLSCDVQGDPDPAVVWSTPWGHQFADPSFFARLESVCTSCRPLRRYSSKAITFESTVLVTEGGRRLRITNFRGLFNGNITCRAFNYLGNDTAVHEVTVFSAIPSTFIDSLFIGAFSAGGFLCFGLIVGSIKLLVLACAARFGKKRKVIRTPTTTAGILSFFSSLKDTSLLGRESLCRDHVSEDFDSSPPSSPSAATALTPLDDALTSSEDQASPTGTWRGGNIRETVEEMSSRMRQGVGQKMKSVRRNVQSIRETGRRNVQSIRESGSMYMQNIRETGSTAASKVKAGVVMGMVTVKSHVQSIKEFCGTGDMGTHTVSAISMETNLDTNETTELVKSITIV